MDLFITSLDINKVDAFINPATDLYARITRRETKHNQTVDIVVHIRSVIVDANNIIIFFPNNAVATINCPSMYYHKIEVL